MVKATSVCFIFVHFYCYISCSEEHNMSFCLWNCTCLGNTVDCSNKDFFYVPGNLPTWIEVLDLASNNIEAIDNVDDLSNLKELNLNGNPLTNKNVFNCGTLHKLNVLRFSNMSLDFVSNFAASINSSCVAGQLYLTHNRLRELNWSFTKIFPRLSFMDLSSNNLSALENSTIPLMVHLHTLILDDNIVNFIAREFFDSVPNLEILKLNRNKIQFLKKGLFVGMKHLKTLELESNKLTSIEGLTFKGLESLVFLNLKRNSISQLMDGAFWGLNSIQMLDISRNNISSIDNRWLYGLESLKQLVLAYNSINVLRDEAWKFTRNITELNLRHNRIAYLSGSSFQQLNLLRRLQLQHNNISHIDDTTFHHLTYLKTLDIGYNNLSWTSDGPGTQFDHLFTLARLVLEHNNIRSLSRRLFRDLTALKHLNVAGGSLASIQSRAFENIQELQYFNMDSKNLLCDCQLVWLLEWLQKHKFQVTAMCSYPETLAGRELLQLTRDELKCFSFSRPVITQEPQSVNGLLGGNVTLTCIAASAGKSLLGIEWKKDNVALDNLKYKEIKVNPIPTTVSSGGTSITQVVSHLILNPLVDGHAGAYQCITSNVIGSTFSVKALVTVNVFPTFAKTPEPNIMARIGTTARFDCSAVGLPPPVITLQKDGGDDFPAARERRMHIYPSDERFFIVNVKPEDQGTYTCSATNPVGVISFNTTLQVLEPPKFIRRMEGNKTVVEGETVMFECQARGSPQPKVEWLKDLKPVVLTLRHFCTGGSQFLIIVQTNRDDEGEYSCIISNTIGSEKQSVHLSVTIPTGEDGMKTSMLHMKDDSTSTTAGIIVIAVVCCIVVTSLAWACIIYLRTRRPYAPCSQLLDRQTPRGIQTKDIKWQDSNLVQQLNEDRNDVSAIIFTKHCQAPRNRASKHCVMPCDGCSENKKLCRYKNDSGTHTMGSNYSSLARSENTLQCLAVAPDEHLSGEMPSIERTYRPPPKPPVITEKVQNLDESKRVEST